MKCSVDCNITYTLDELFDETKQQGHLLTKTYSPYVTQSNSVITIINVTNSRVLRTKYCQILVPNDKFHHRFSRQITFHWFREFVTIEFDCLCVSSSVLQIANYFDHFGYNDYFAIILASKIAKTNNYNRPSKTVQKFCDFLDQFREFLDLEIGF